MADMQSYLWILPLIHVMSFVSAVTYTRSADMELATTCDKIGGFKVGDSDIMHLYANPPLRPGGTATRDHCIVEVSAPLGRRLRLYILDYRSADCGTVLEIYEGSTHMISPSRVLNCQSEPVKIDSQFETVRIKLKKQSAAANNYRISIAITTDQGPDIEFERNMATYASPVLSIEAIIGLAVAGIILLIAIVAIAIYCVVKNRSKNASSDDDDDKRPYPEPSAYTSVPVDDRKARRNRYEMSRPSETRRGRRDYV